MVKAAIYGLVVLLVAVMPVLAIDDVTKVEPLELGQMHTLKDGGLTFSYPDEWVVLEGQDVVIVVSRQEILQTRGPNDLASGDVIFFLYPSVRLLPNYPQTLPVAETTPASIISFYSKVGVDLGYTAHEDIEMPIIGNGARMASRAVADSPRNQHERQVIAMEAGNGDIVTLFVFTDTGGMVDINPTIEAILASIELDSI